MIIKPLSTSIKPRYLSKSDFKVAQDCPSKLFYKKQRYPSDKNEDEYLRLLAEGGFMVEKIAKLLAPCAIEMNFNPADPEKSFRDTQEALRAENVTICEATLISNGKLARVDILRKKGNTFDLVEVKAKSYDSREQEAAVRKGRPNLFRNKDGSLTKKDHWPEYLKDVTFQFLVLKELYPDSTIRPFLCLPDKATTTKIDNLYSLFSLSRICAGESPYERYEVAFRGDVEQLRKDNFLIEVSVASEVEYLSESVKSLTERYSASLEPQPKKLPTQLTTACRDCEYRATNTDSRDGFRECWGAHADVRPNILDLWNAGKMSGGNGIKANDLIREGQVNLLGVTEEHLRNRQGELGPIGVRQLIQIQQTRDNKEWLNKDLLPLLTSYKYPLHFIDFETSTLAIPYHAGMRPYESIAFQWSCHTIDNEGEAPRHREWINTTDSFPNFEFAQTLKNAIGTNGTVFRYAHHETTILKAIRGQMDIRQYRDKDLEFWLDEMSADDRIVDLQRLTIAHYYHPLMKGSNSIKQVVEAIWKTNSALHKVFPEYKRMVDGEILSPYAALPALEIQGKPVTIAEGTGAMRAYEAMMFGIEKDDPSVCTQWRRLLLQYCKLDTAAMVMIWMYWLDKLSATGPSSPP